MPYERARRDSGSRRKGWVIDDLEARHVIEVTCTKCGRETMIAPHILHARYRASVQLGAIKLKCSACGCRGVTWEVLEARPPRDARGY